MSFYFLKAGMQTSIQDVGRSGFMHLGVSTSGAMDINALRAANWLVNKPTNSAAIEITLIGPKIKFEGDLTIAICGAKFDLLLNNERVYCNETIQVKYGDLLEFKRLIYGARAYIAFSGEAKIKPVLGNFSTHLTASLGGIEGNKISNGERIFVTNAKPIANKKLPSKYVSNYLGKYLIRCVKSVESESFSDEQFLEFFDQRYQVEQQSNRMGIRLKGRPMLFSKNLEITSSGLTQGSIQVPPSGQPIISSVDGQTIGGYPRIANVISVDLPVVGQLKANDCVNFTLVDQNYAEAAQIKLKKIWNDIS